MTTTEVLLAAVIVGGFALLLLTLGAFVTSRYVLGVVGLVLAGAAFLSSLFLMAQVSADQKAATREAIRAKYAVKIEEWGGPLGSAPEWKIDGKVVSCDVDLTDRSDPVLTCDERELPLR